MNKIYILIFVLFLCCLILIIGITVYVLNKKNNYLSLFNQNKNQVYNLGQILQKDELELSNDNFDMLFSVIPSGIIDTNPVNYSMSFDCYIENQTQRCIFTINNDSNNNGDVAVITRENQILIGFFDNNKPIAAQATKSLITLKQWFNITFVVQNNDFIIYFNGINAGLNLFPGKNKILKWFSNKNFKWNTIIPDVDKKDIYGKIKVKNLVFWNIPLTKSQIDIISKQ